MSNQGKWIVNIEEAEVWNHTEEFETKEQAIAYVKEDFEGFFEEETGLSFNSEIDNRVFYVGKIDRFAPYVDGDHVIEQVAESAYDEVGEVAESYLDHVSKEQLNILNKRLNSVFSEWLKETNNQPTFWKVVNVEKVVL